MATSEKHRRIVWSRRGEGPANDLADLVSAAALACRTPMAAAGVLERDEVVYQTTHGLSPIVLPRESTFCDYTLDLTDALVVTDASHDRRFAGLPQVEGPPHIRYYAGVPVVAPGNRVIGTMCVFDTRPRTPRRDEIDLLHSLARVVARRMPTLASGTTPTPGEANRARPRSELASMLAHELGSPLTAIRFSGYVLVRNATNPQAQRAARVICSASERMRRMLGRLIDLQGLQSGEGIALVRGPANLGEICLEVSEELRAGHPDRAILLSMSGNTSGTWDTDRLQEAVSNLVTNALVHGSPDGEVKIMVRGLTDRVVVSVHNQGESIPAEDEARIFKPFERGSGNQGAPGLGLGLYLARHVARAHGGDLTFTSSAAEGTTFSLSLPALATT
jgi:signal transduction histidine kinase